MDGEVDGNDQLYSLIRNPENFVNSPLLDKPSPFYFCPTQCHFEPEELKFRCHAESKHSGFAQRSFFYSNSSTS